jgi:hypothetical protein
MEIESLQVHAEGNSPEPTLEPVAVWATARDAHLHSLGERMTTETPDDAALGRGRRIPEVIRTKPHATVGVALVIVLIAVGMAAIKAGATEQHRSGQRLGSESTVSASVPERVDLFGDSLGYQAEPYLRELLAETHDYYTLSGHTYGGTATCDWLSKMTTAATHRPLVAILVFSGNALSPCMEGVAPESARYFDLYTTYTEQAIDIFSAVDTHVFLVGTPIDESSAAGWERLDDIYQHMAQANPLTVTYVDAGAAVESATGRFVWTLPCMSIEPSCGPNRSNVVRSPDGVHFCPGAVPASRGVTGPCNEYSSGALRFALAIASALTQYASLASEDGRSAQKADQDRFTPALSVRANRHSRER